MEELQKSTKRNCNTDKNKKIKAMPKSVLEAFENIVDLAKDSNLDEKFYKKAGNQIEYAVEALDLTPTQIVLLALFVDNSENIRIRISDLSKFIGCRTTRILRLADDIDFLEKKRYIRASRSDQSLTYRVPMCVLGCLRRNLPYHYEKDPITDLLSFFFSFNRLMNEKDNEEISYEDIMEQTEELLNEIKDTKFAKVLRSLSLNDYEQLLFIFMAHLYFENDDDKIGFYDIDNLYDNDDIPSWIKRGLRNGKLNLFEYKLIEYANEDGMAKTDTFKLTNYAKDELLAELDLDQFGRSQKGLIKHDSLSTKELIYNQDEKSSIEELTSILTKDRFNGVQERLHKAGMRKGFCCLFYGSPGTGKTETVYQIAKRTGRNIMKVDVDKIKSCWVGESEKNIKAIFDRYRNMCNNTDLAPILLFNEADAVLGVRMEGAARAVDKMENSIQNIILQEMENLEGIMIATTNLTNNLDKAFERRFLYKVRYEKPTAEARKKIWEIMLPGISTETAHALSSRFDMSGGEIENIARKHMVNAILSGDETIDVDKLSDMCQKERIATQTQRIGF